MGKFKYSVLKTNPNQSMNGDYSHFHVNCSASLAVYWSLVVVAYSIGFCQ